MIIIQARIPVQSERRNVAYQHIHDFVGQTRSERGCIGCEAFVSLEDPDVIVIQQAWRGSEELDEHAAGTCLDNFLEALPLFVDGEVSTLRYDAVGDESDLATHHADDSLTDDSFPDDFAEPPPAGVTFH